MAIFNLEGDAGRKLENHVPEAKPKVVAPGNQTMPTSVYRLSRTGVITEALLRDVNDRDVSEDVVPFEGTKIDV